MDDRNIDEPVDCVHCGLPVPAALVKEEGDSFCCHGCETVYGLLHSLKDKHPDFSPEEYVLQQPQQEDTEASSRYARLASPSFVELYSQLRDDGYREIVLSVVGIHCSACIWLLEKLPSMLDGVVSAQLNMGRALLRVVWNPNVVGLDRIAYFLYRMGYPVEVFGEQDGNSSQKRYERQALIRIGVAGALAGNVMMIAFALYGGMFSYMADDHRQFFRWMSLALATPSVMWAGFPFFQRAWMAIRTRTLHMDLPIALGIAIGYLSGLWNTLIGKGEIYFDSVTTLIFLLLVGRWLQHRQQRLAQERTEKLYYITPKFARLWSGGASQEVPVAALQKDDIIEVLAGETVAVDGEILEGQTQIDGSILTGESLPFAAQEGEEVHAGTLNVSSRILVKVNQTGEETRVGQIMLEVQRASQSRAPIVRMADSVVGVFIVVVFGLAFATWVMWSFLSPTHAVEHAIALLIITCPCALGMATPLAVAASLGRAAKQGILIKGGQALEALSRPGILWLDKTGTLTQGALSLVHWEGSEDVKPVVQAIEAQSSHPIAKALSRDLPLASTPLQVEAEQHHGAGIVGHFRGRDIFVGSLDFMQRHVEETPSWVTQKVEEWTAKALTPIAIVEDGDVIAMAALGDPIREEAAEVLQDLRTKGWQVGILSGDHPSVVDAVGVMLDIPQALRVGGASPERKLELVRSSQEQGTVVMIGDGVNDTAALAAAHVGIGVHGGAEACLAAADIFLSRPGLVPLQEVMNGAKLTMRTIRRNLTFSFFYNVIGASLAMAGLINPLWAAIFMPISSLTVVTHSFRASSFGDTSCPSSTSSSPSLSSSPVLP